jgi:ATP-dependent helicase HepA
MRGYNLGNMRLDIEIDEKEGVISVTGPDWVIKNVPTLRRKLFKVFTYNHEESIFQAGINKESVNLLLSIVQSTEQKKQLKDALGKLDNDENLLTRDDSEDYCIESKDDSGLGFIVDTRAFGLCRLISINEQGTATLECLDSQQSHQIGQGNYTRYKIPEDTICKHANGECTCVSLIKRDENWSSPFEYKVEFEDGRSKKVKESELTPLKIAKPKDPLHALSTLQHHSLYSFQAREKLNLAYIDLIRRGSGVKSLLTSRIDLHPHQAYVAGTIMLDDKQRYLLADEVGLGKTIEAGLIIHDFITRNKDSNILILTPGALLQQWFAEMYSKFIGIVFKIADLSGFKDTNSKKHKRIITSFNAALKSPQNVTDQEWDLVIVDEVHHLLHHKPLYDLVQKISSQDRGLLLLSALPAKHREEEYFDLLALLEPKKYSKDDPNELTTLRDEFKHLYDRQREIGSRVNIAKRRLAKFQDGDDKSASKVIKQIKEILEIPVIAEDFTLKEKFLAINASDSSNENFLELVENLLFHISYYYRINRRIIRNRREKLIENKQLKRISRGVKCITYKPNQYEIEAIDALEEFLRHLKDSDVPEGLLHVLSKQLLQATIHPSLLHTTLTLSKNQLPPDSLSDNFEDLDDLISYSEWDDMLENCWYYTRAFIDNELLEKCLETSEAWSEMRDDENNRLKKWISFLQKKHSANPKEKFILFAGFPKLAGLLYEQLSEIFGKEEIARFYYGMDEIWDEVREREIKEEEVRRFKVNPQTWLLICDETGGEGRNFQFVSELFHYDLPLQASKIEQRIGRLDRIGREKDEVLSTTIVSKGSKEESWFKCLKKGLSIFKQSISGLEFGLREIEENVTRNFLSEDSQMLEEMIPVIKEKVLSERARDEAEAQMDEASFNASHAQSYLKAQLKKKQEIHFEKTFTNYFKQISDRRSVSTPYDPLFSDGIFEFLPKYIKDLKLDVLEKQDERKGTFRREIAQERPNDEFFSPGNEFFDFIINAMRQDVFGRSYAIECLDESFPQWRGFEFSYRVLIEDNGKQLESTNSGFIEHFFNDLPINIFIDEKGELLEEEKSRLVLSIRKKLYRDTEKKIWWDLKQQHSILLTEYYPDWKEMIKKLEKVCRKKASAGFKEKLEPLIKEKQHLLSEKVHLLTHSKPDGWQDSIKNIEKLHSTLSEWNVHLDTIGFISINGGVRNA